MKTPILEGSGCPESLGLSLFMSYLDYAVQQFKMNIIFFVHRNDNTLLIKIP